MCEEYLAGDYVEDWDVDSLLTQLEQMYPVAVAPEEFDPATADRAALVEELRKDVVQHYDERDQIGRNDPCWCGSGKKFKKCHGA